MARPRPVPLGFEVAYGSNARAGIFVENPGRYQSRINVSLSGQIYQRSHNAQFR